MTSNSDIDVQTTLNRLQGVVTVVNGLDVPNFINGKFVQSQSTEKMESKNPATDEIIALVPKSTQQEMEEAVKSSEEAFKSWKQLSVGKRVRVMLKYQDLLKQNQKEIAAILTREQGKTLQDAFGDVQRGLEVVEHCCSFQSLLMGESSNNLARDLDTVSFRTPLGVCAGVAPFNFPAMIPLWMFPVALTCGNTFVMKPSEKVPQTMMFLAKLIQDAGLPNGCLNIVHGDKAAVDFLLDSPVIKAISFVGSNAVGEYIHKRGTAQGKRVQANLGAKNHAIVLPDAHRKSAVNAIVTAAFGAAGQRCMALSVAVLVGKETESWIEDLKRSAQDLVVGPGDAPNVDVGPLVDAAAKNRVLKIAALGMSQGNVEMILDGTKDVKGNFVNPTIVKLNGPKGIENAFYTEELFGPVLTVLCVDTFEEALSIVNSNKYGNGSSIFTSSGAHARKFQHECESGQLGINVPIPVPLSHFSFSGNKASILGSNNFYGKSGMQFFTQWKTVTSKWSLNADDDTPWSTAMPTLGKM